MCRLMNGVSASRLFVESGFRQHCYGIPRFNFNAAGVVGGILYQAQSTYDTITLFRAGFIFLPQFHVQDVSILILKKIHNGDKNHES